MPRTDAGVGSPAASNALEAVLAEARQLGFLGPGPLEQQLRHAHGFVVVAQPLFALSPRLVDMGAGGGLPGLVVAEQWPEVVLVLLEANERRSAFLERAVERLELGERVSVLQERAEICGRDPEWRASFDGAIARSFGKPAVLAECTAPLLKVGAWMVVSEPPTSSSAGTGPAPPDSAGDSGESGTTSRGTRTPGSRGPGAHASDGEPGTRASEGGPVRRWPERALRELGLEPGELVHAEFDYQLLRQVETCSDRYPRRNGVPAKKPLF